MLFVGMEKAEGKTVLARWEWGGEHWRCGRGTLVVCQWGSWCSGEELRLEVRKRKSSPYLQSQGKAGGHAGQQVSNLI